MLPDPLHAQLHAQLHAEILLHAPLHATLCHYMVYYMTITCSITCHYIEPNQITCSITCFITCSITCSITCLITHSLHGYVISWAHDHVLPPISFLIDRVIPIINAGSDAPAAIFDHRFAVVQVRLQRRSEIFSMLGMELDTDCQHLLQIWLGKLLRQQEQKCQVMYVNQEVCKSIKDYVHQSSISRLVPCACRP